MATDPIAPVPGFQLQPIGRRWARLACQSCGKCVTFVNASEDRVSWYVKVHRCGPAGSAWHADVPMALEARDAGLLTDLTNALCSAARAMEVTPLQAFERPAVHLPARMVAGHLEDALRAVGHPTLHVVRGNVRGVER